MGGSFDPYHKWLGIPPREQPPDHYRLLGIAVFESDPEVIEAAADRQMVHIRTYQTGKHSAESQRLLNELAAARICLLNPPSKAAYDAALRARTVEPPAVVLEPSVGFYVKGAARYLAAQSHRLWIHQTRLPAAYWRLGIEVHRERRYVDRLQDLYAQVDSLALRLDSLALTDEGSPEGKPIARMGRKEPVWWRRWTRAGQAFQLRRKRASLLTTIGRRAYAVDAKGCGPVDLVRAIDDELGRLNQLRSEVDELSKVPPGQVISPARLAWIAVGVIGLFVSLWLLFRLR